MSRWSKNGTIIGPFFITFKKVLATFLKMESRFRKCEFLIYKNKKLLFFINLRTFLFHLIGDILNIPIGNKNVLRLDTKLSNLMFSIDQNLSKTRRNIHYTFDNVSH